MKIMTMAGGEKRGQSYEQDLNNGRIDMLDKSMLALVNNQETLCQKVNTQENFSTKVMHLIVTTLFFLKGKKEEGEMGKES